MDINEIDAALGSARRTFVDSSTCIANFSTMELAHPLARHVFDRVADDADPLMAYISVVSAAEMLVRLLQDEIVDRKEILVQSQLIPGGTTAVARSSR